MKLVSLNIQYGFGADGRYDLSRAARAVAQADIIALQEVERNWERTGFDDQPAILQELLPEHHGVFGPAFDMDASSRVAGGPIINRRRQFGTMVLSRWPILWSRLYCLPMRKVLYPLNTQNAALECMIRTPLGPIRVWSIHLSHIGVEERLEQIAFLKDLHRRAAKQGGPWSGVDDEPHRNWTAGEAEPEAPLSAIWMGDFNSEPGSAEHQAIIGSNPYHPSALYADGFVDAAEIAPPVQDYSHVRQIKGTAQQRRLDYCFVGAPLAGHIRSHHISVDELASDHFPVWTSFDPVAQPRR
ncbi:endonuclease/exonuclease/phosphatase family protein [Tianweitania sediminis]|uniref:EEP domain-containing protein n=1 Tax=Tianweitania sediminis TaxID=1502156 RepID=A0A8J7UJ22_9HYPH|nr:endonuclease/exonuclease/phosphatase family protein [Tianweitania sediminis]MBP0438239.1 EEP domain-containing protein [Tianweitania sediminis]